MVKLLHVKIKTKPLTRLLRAIPFPSYAHGHNFKISISVKNLGSQQFKGGTISIFVRYAFGNLTEQMNGTIPVINPSEEQMVDLKGRDKWGGLGSWTRTFPCKYKWFERKPYSALWWKIPNPSGSTNNCHDFWREIEITSETNKCIPCSWILRINKRLNIHSNRSLSECFAGNSLKLWQTCWIFRLFQKGCRIFDTNWLLCHFFSSALSFPHLSYIEVFREVLRKANLICFWPF